MKVYWRVHLIKGMYCQILVLSQLTWALQFDIIANLNVLNPCMNVDLKSYSRQEEVFIA